jgi:hypothetical protein
VNEWRGVLKGILLLIGLHLAAIVGGFIMMRIAIWISNFSPANLQQFLRSIPLAFISVVLFNLGIFQLLYVVPTVVILYRNRRISLMKGVIIGAVLTVLLNGSCYIWVRALSL